MVGDGVIDLSLVDNAGRYRGYRTTANCYLVHKAGKYKLPLVYGNAIKDGQVNTVAFAPGGTTTTTYCANFINHNSSNINAPWITKSSSGSGVDKGMGLTASSVELLWQDAKGLITDVGLSNDGNYLCFEVGTYKGGNALLCVKDSNSSIMWSWHIWATDNTLENTTRVATGSHNYDVAPVNIGWVVTGGSGKQGYCTYYQFGRKDAFIPAASYSSTSNHTVYDVNGNTVMGIYYSSTVYSLQASIRNPNRHYYSSSSSNWFDKSWNNLWNAQNETMGNITTAAVKTIYDPCPPDFVVPTSNLYYYMGNNGTRTMSTWDSTNKGATWNIGITGDALWFPACGSRTSSSFSLGSVGTDERYHSASGNSSTNVRNLRANSSNWSYTTTLRAGGTAIRPVKEE